MMGEYCVYEHVFPNGKKYVGISTNPHRRWKWDGSGYINNQPMWKAIQKYGWKNIQHNIIESGLSRTEAGKKEKELIEKYDLIKKGFNQRPGGAASKCLYSKHVNEMIRSCKRFSWLDNNLLPFAERMLELSEEESWAYQVNLVDYVLRTEVDGYMNGLAKTMGDSMYEVLDWYYYIAFFTVHPEIDLRTIEPPIKLPKRSDK